MKLRVHRKQGLLAERVECSLAIKDPIAGLLPFIVGRALIFNEDPRQVFLKFKFQNASAILEFWFRSGYIIGSPELWKLSPGLMNKLRASLNLGVAKLEMRTEKKSVQHSLRFIVSLFSRLRKESPGKVPDLAPRSRANLFRIFCLAYPTIDMEKMILNFFKQLTQDYSLQHFQKYLVAHAGVKPVKFRNILMPKQAGK